MRQTKSLVHFEILYVYSKVSVRTLGFLWTKSKSRIRTFFWLSVRRKLSLFWEKKVKSRFWTWLTFFSGKMIFRFSKKMLWGSGAIFLRLLGSHRRKMSRWKNLSVFQRLMFFVPVSQLSTRDLFYFLENLKIKQDIFVLSFSPCSIIRTRSIMIPLFQIFWNKMFKKMLILECLGCFTKSIVVSILDFWHISFRKMFEWMTCKMKIITFWVAGDI